MRGLLTPPAPAVPASATSWPRAQVSDLLWEELPFTYGCEVEARASTSGPSERVLPLHWILITHHPQLSSFQNWSQHFKDVSSSKCLHPLILFSLHLYFLSKATWGAQVIKTLAWLCVRSVFCVSMCLADDVAGLLATAAHWPPPSAMPGFPPWVLAELTASGCWVFCKCITSHSPTPNLTCHSWLLTAWLVALLQVCCQFCLFVCLFLSLFWFTFQCLEVVTYDCTVISYFEVTYKNIK